MSNNLPEEFAFGGNEVDGCACPALAAGMHPENARKHPNLLGAAESYDSLMKEYGLGERRTNTYGVGVASESEAKQAWIDMMELAITNNFYHAEAAIEVAEKLGWVEEGEYETKPAF